MDGWHSRRYDRTYLSLSRSSRSPCPAVAQQQHQVVGQIVCGARLHRNARDQNSVFLLVRQPSITERTSARRFFTRHTQLSRLQRSVHILEAVIWSHTIHSNYIYFQWKRRLIRPRTPAAALVACTTSRCCTSASVRVDILAGMKRSAVGKSG